MKLEVLVVPVSDVDRAQRFYETLGFRQDIDYAVNGDYRVIQFTTPGSGAEFVERGFNVVANSRKMPQSTVVAASDHVALVDGDIGEPATAARIVEGFLYVTQLAIKQMLAQ